MTLKMGCILVGCLVPITALAQGGVELPNGAELVGGAIADDGQVFFVVRGETVGDGSFLIRRKGATEDVLELPNTWVKRARLLENGRLLLFSSKGPVIEGRRSLSLDIIKTRAKKAVTLWSWDSRPACQRECEPPVVSSDGKLWGVFSSDQDRPTRGAFTFGPTKRARRGGVRTELVEFGAPNRNDFPESSFFWFLDSANPVVMVPWSGGAYVVHFTDGGSPYTVPVLQGAQVSLRWQRKDRLLWVDSGSCWSAYHLWDLGLSGVPSEALWEHKKVEGWEPHPERGVVRVVRGEGAYRIEHIWREPSSSLEERHVSDWHPGEPPPSGFGSDWLVSANGQHGAILEDFRLEGAIIEFNAASFQLRFEPGSQPPIRSAERMMKDMKDPGSSAESATMSR